MEANAPRFSQRGGCKPDERGYRGDFAALGLSHTPRSSGASRPMARRRGAVKSALRDKRLSRTLRWAQRFGDNLISTVRRKHHKETAMRIKAIALATAFSLSTTLASAQAGGNTAGGSSAAGGSAASKTTTGESKDGATYGGGSPMKDAPGYTTGSSMPSPKDASTQGADSAGSAEKKGDAATPGGTRRSNSKS